MRLLLALGCGFGVLLTLGGSLAAQQVEVPKFKSVDEAIGWTKARGSCERIRDQGDAKCNIRFDLPMESRPEPRGQRSSWDVWAWIQAVDMPDAQLRSLSIHIVRSRKVALSATDDPNLTVRSVRTSQYHFGRDGRISEVLIGFALENGRGERILDESIPLPREHAHKHGQGALDYILFTGPLGIGWKY
jgi:hypothetical protein